MIRESIQQKNSTISNPYTPTNLAAEYKMWQIWNPLRKVINQVQTYLKSKLLPILNSLSQSIWLADVLVGPEVASGAGGKGQSLDSELHPSHRVSYSVRPPRKHLQAVHLERLCETLAINLRFSKWIRVAISRSPSALTQPWDPAAPGLIVKGKCHLQLHLGTWPLRSFGQILSTVKWPRIMLQGIVNI